MSKPDFTQDNVNRKIAELKALPDAERKTVSDDIKKDVRAWLVQTFNFSDAYKERLAMWPLSMREETGFGIGTAIYYKEWTLEILMPTNAVPGRGRKTQHEQKVSGSMDPMTGTYTVSKSHTWSW